MITYGQLRYIFFILALFSWQDPSHAAAVRARRAWVVFSSPGHASLRPRYSFCATKTDRNEFCLVVVMVLRVLRDLLGNCNQQPHLADDLPIRITWRRTLKLWPIALVVLQLFPGWSSPSTDLLCRIQGEGARLTSEKPCNPFSTCEHLKKVLGEHSSLCFLIIHWSQIRLSKRKSSSTRHFHNDARRYSNYTRMLNLHT